MLLNVDKDLPSLPGYAEIGRQMRLQVPPSTGGMVNATRSRPTLNLDKRLSPEELILLRDRWNEATSTVCGICTILFMSTYSSVPAARSL